MNPSLIRSALSTLVFTVLFSQLSFSQIYTRKELNKQIRIAKTATGTDQMKQTLKLSEAYFQFNIDSANVYANKAYEMSKDLKIRWGKMYSIFLRLKGTYFQRGVPVGLLENTEKLLSWFRKNGYKREEAMVDQFRLMVLNSSQGREVVKDQVDLTIRMALEAEDDRIISNAYYSKMSFRKVSHKWSDDVHNLDSARIFATRSNDAMQEARIDLLNTLPINGSRKAFKVAFAYRDKAMQWQSPELSCVSNSTIGLCYGGIRKSDSSMLYLREALQQSRVYKNRVHEMQVLILMMYSYRYSNMIDSTLKYTEKALDLCREMEFKPMQSHILRELGDAWIRKGKKAKGIDYILESSKLAKEVKDEYYEYSTQRMLAYFYIESERYQEADSILTKMREWSLTLDDGAVANRTRSVILKQIGSYFEAQEIIDSAVYYYQESINMSELNRHTFSTDYRILHAYIRKGDIQKAKEHYDYLMANYAEGILKMEVDFQFDKGELMYHLGKNSQSQIALNKFLEKTERVESDEMIYKSHEMLADLYQSSGDLRKAIYHSNKAFESYQAMIEEEDILKLEKIQSRFDLAKKQSKIEQLENEQLRQESSIAEQESKLQIRRLLLISLSVLMLLLIVIFVLNQRRNKEMRKREASERNILEKERRIEQMKAQETERTAQLKNQLFANISHEFRTPLTLIQVPVEEMMKEADPSAKKPLQVIRRNTEHLLIMVEELLELARLDAGNTSLSIRPIQINPFIHKIQTNFDPLFRQQQIDLIVNFPKESYVIEADEHQLRIVLNNLLKNAFHHTSVGGSVELSIWRDSNNLSISLFNEGEPVEESLLPVIFDRYSRSDENEYSGYGIGLSLCRQIVELHKGQIDVKNSNNGVEFSFFFPTSFEVYPEPLISTANSKEDSIDHAPISGDKKKLLVVEDNVEMRSLLNDVLKDQYDLAFAEDGEQGVQLAREQQLDLIISDIMMPKMEGTELTKVLKTSFETSHIPIILLTAKAATANRIEGLEYGADDYLTKPFNPNELRARVKNLIEQRERLRKRFSKNAFILPEDVTPNTLDQEFLKNATSVVEEHFSDGAFTVEVFCRKLALNRNSVHQKLKSITGMSASQFIRSIKLKRAARLLIDERLPIIEVAELAGFNNRQAFNKSFKEQFEMTPSEYRKKEIEERR